MPSKRFDGWLRSSHHWIGRMTPWCTSVQILSAGCRGPSATRAGNPGFRRKGARRVQWIVDPASLDAVSIELYGVHESLHRKGEERVNRRHFLVSSAAAV